MSTAAAGAEGEPLPAPKRLAPDPLGRVVFALLVLACLLAFFLTQRLKHTPTVVQKFELTPYFSPFPGGHEKEESISFKLDRAEDVSVLIEDAKGRVVATLLESHPVVRYKQFSLRWGGRRGTAYRYAVHHTRSGRVVLVPATRGAIAPPGEYRVRLLLSRQSREVRSPRSFTLVGR